MININWRLIHSSTIRNNKNVDLAYWRHKYINEFELNHFQLYDDISGSIFVTASSYYC
jgi:hypothetical protein